MIDQKMSFVKRSRKSHDRRLLQSCIRYGGPSKKKIWTKIQFHQLLLHSNPTKMPLLTIITSSPLQYPPPLAAATSSQTSKWSGISSSNSRLNLPSSNKPRNTKTKVEVIRAWPTPTLITSHRTVRGLRICSVSQHSFRSRQRTSYESQTRLRHGARMLTRKGLYRVRWTLKLRILVSQRRRD